MKNRWSPCVGICQIDADTELCVGCFRSLDEICRWGQIPLNERERIMQTDLKEREAEHGARFEDQYS